MVFRFVLSSIARFASDSSNLQSRFLRSPSARSHSRRRPSGVRVLHSPAPQQGSVSASCPDLESSNRSAFNSCRKSSLYGKPISTTWNGGDSSVATTFCAFVIRRAVRQGVSPRRNPLVITRIFRRLGPTLLSDHDCGADAADHFALSLHQNSLLA